MIRKITQEMRRHIFAARDFALNENDRPLAADYDVCVVGSGPGGRWRRLRSRDRD